MTISDDNQKPKPAKKLGKSLDAISALRIAMEERLAEAQQEEKKSEQPTPEPPPKAESKKSEEPPLQPLNPQNNIHDPGEWMRIMFHVAEQSQKLIQEYMERNKGKSVAAAVPPIDPAHLAEAFGELSNRILNDPENFVNAQIALWQGYTKIWQNALNRMQGKPAEPVVTPLPSDKRFKDKEWQTNWLFDYIKQSYLLTSQWVRGFVNQESEKLDPKLARKLEFYTRQMVDAISPSNFWLTNPEVLRATFETGGENLIKGLENMLADLERGGGHLRISMSDLKAFKVGTNLAITPGKVVYQNDLIQLIQYAPQTPTVHSVPLLIMPPWINKYYILDLSEKKSYIRYLVEQGYTVFCISWVNPDARHAKTNFDDYMTEGALTAMQQVRQRTGCDAINMVGYCIGGTLLASTLAYLNAAPAAPHDLPKVVSATYLVTLTDFADPGDLGVFIDDDQVKAIEEKMATRGYLDAESLATTFNLLRANDLIWSFVINNYLLGKEPFPFDILYWNGDSTNLPAAMHSFYLREMYIKNKLREPNGLSMKGVPIDLRSITTPSFMISTREDHIAPWRSTYASTQLYKGPVTFVLAGSGHIAGIVNPPDANKYGYWTNDKCPPTPTEWLKTAKQHDGSWWVEWLRWLAPYAGEQVPAREISKGIEDAPGSYVKVRAI